jgi:membrane protein implicated in regulation of membrane protease activity
MWLIFAGLAMLSVVLLWAYDRWVKAHPQKSESIGG